MNDATYEFVMELTALLRKHKVEMQGVHDDSAVNFWSYAQYNEDHEMVRDNIDYTTYWLNGD